MKFNKFILFLSLLLLFAIPSESVVKLNPEICTKYGDCTYLNLTVTGNLTVIGNITYTNSTINTNFYNISGDLNVTGCLKFPNGASFCQNEINTSTGSNLTINSDVEIIGNIDINHNITAQSINVTEVCVIDGCFNTIQSINQTGAGGGSGDGTLTFEVVNEAVPGFSSSIVARILPT